MQKLLLGTILLLSISCFASVTVNISSPAASSSITSPMALKANATSSNPITGWHVYIDGKDSYASGANSSISGNVPISSGTHTILVRAWDSSGAYGSRQIQVTVGGTTTTSQPDTSSSTGLPTPPSTAKVFSNIDQMTGWTSCGTAACAGGSGKSSYWMALNQTSPSMDGNSVQFYNSGVWANALWWKKFGAVNSATNLLWDFWIYVDENAANRVQTLEFDSFQFVGGWNYMIGTQCNYAYGVWDTWNAKTNKWVHSTIKCPKFTAKTWHHIQQYVTTNHSTHTYTYKTFVVDGKVFNVNVTQPALYNGWHDNLGTQWQIDVNATGAGVHEWVDKAKLTVW